jgi:CBS domain-containing membrane protein
MACFGALLGIGLTALVCSAGFNGLHLSLIPLLVAPMGASAVLLFAVPASPLAQPWSIIGGNTVSALVGITVVRFISDPIAASALAVALAIGAMSLLRCLHPPGGAAALTAVLGGPAVMASGYMFALAPVALDSALLVIFGWLFHRLSNRHAYPHSASDIPPHTSGGFRREDVDKALRDLGETLDIDRNDLDHLLRQIEFNARCR